jgi:hypothetical protein
MSFRPGLSLLRTCARARAPVSAAAPARGFHYLSQQPGTQRATAHMQRARPQAVAITRSLPRQSGSGSGNSHSGAGAGTGLRTALALGLGIAAISFSRPARLDAAFATPGVDPNVIVVENRNRSRPQPPQSMVSVPQLTFGATCGICAGVFVKKGFKLIAFALGGVFVLLQVSASGRRQPACDRRSNPAKPHFDVSHDSADSQYLSSRRFVSVDWSAVSKSYDGTFAEVDQNGNVQYPTPTGVLNGMIDFLTANFQRE